MFRHLKLSSIISRLLNALALLQCGSASAHGKNDQSSPVIYRRIVRHHPNFSIHVITVDLNDPRVTVRVAKGGPDSDGDGPWTTTLEPVSEIANRENFDIAINGDFFTAQDTRDIEGRKTGYIRGKFATPEGIAMTDGQLWHRPAGAFPYLAITTNHTARFGKGNLAGPPDPSFYQILCGSQIIVSNGAALEYTSEST
jgi:hypothetical protein